MKRPSYLIGDLDPETRFRLAMRGGRTGVVLAVGTGGVRVRYDAAAPHALGDGTTFARPAETLTISPQTEVILV